jgi:hypothetical protein
MAKQRDRESRPKTPSRAEQRGVLLPSRRARCGCTDSALISSNPLYKVLTRPPLSIRIWEERTGFKDDTVFA